MKNEKAPAGNGRLHTNETNIDSVTDPGDFAITETRWRP
jgi:hypothetical protein